MNVLVAGGAGFIGSHLCERLLAEGHRVTALDNLLTGSASNLSALRRHRTFRFLNTRRAAPGKPLRIPGALHRIYHLASPASPVDYQAYPIETLQAGTFLTCHLLELARGKKARVLLASTSEVYGDPEVHPQVESYWGHVNPIGMRSMYDESKRAAEAYMMAYRRARRTDTRIARIFNTYGERMRLDDGRVVPNFVSQALKGAPLTVYGDGSQTRSFCYVSDLVEGLVRLMEAPPSADIHLPVNLGNPEEHTVREFAEIIRRLTGSRSAIIRKPLPPDDPKRRCPDISRAKRLLGWAPRVRLEEGLRRTVEWFRPRVRASSRATRTR